MKIFNSSTNPSPRYSTPDSAGLDLASVDTLYIEKGVRTLIRTGIHVEIPVNHVGLLIPRSSLSKKYIYMTNSVGVIDADYRGEIMASLVYNPTNGGLEHAIIEKGERIVQLVIVPYVKVEIQDVKSVTKLDETTRGSGGFGSTGT